MDLTSKKVWLLYPDLVPLLYPSFGILRGETDLRQVGRGVIYYAAQGMREDEIDRAVAPFSRWIAVLPNTSTIADLEVPDREQTIRLVSDVRGIRFNSEIVRKTKDLTDDEFLHLVRMSLALKRWYREGIEKGEKVYKLFAAMGSSRSEFVQIYFELLKTMTPQEIFASTLTFLSRVGIYHEQKEQLSDYYREVVRKGRQMLPHLRPAFEELASMSTDIPFELRSLAFCLSVRGQT